MVMNGLINVFKEKGMTSHDVVSRLRRILGTKKIGHGGTLDPEVEGVLVIGVGTGTRLLEYITDQGKGYEGTLAFGYASDTEDMTGHVVAKPYDEKNLSIEKIDDLFSSLSNQEMLQIPPMYSSVKVNGRKLYEYAREGKVIDRDPRPVFIEILKRIGPIEEKTTGRQLPFYAKVSKGTYIRTLCVTIGETLEIPSVMGSLKRTSVGSFLIEDSLKLDAIKTLMDEENFSFLKPLKSGINKEMPIIYLEDKEAKKIFCGQRIDNREQFLEGTMFACLYNNQLFSICTVEDNSIKVLKNVCGVENGIF